MSDLITRLKRHFSTRFPFFHRCTCKVYCIAGETYEYSCRIHEAKR